MNRKHNPFVSLVALLLAAVILALTCTGCARSAPPAAAGTEINQPNRFDTEYTQGNYIRIITDTETGVQYLVYTARANGSGTGMGVGITVLQPAAEEG